MYQLKRGFMKENWVDSGKKVQTGFDSDGNLTFSKIQYCFNSDGLVCDVRLKKVEKRYGILDQPYFKEIE
jgi:hypothetical protein